MDHEILQSNPCGILTSIDLSWIDEAMWPLSLLGPSEELSYVRLQTYFPWQGSLRAHVVIHFSTQDDF